MAGNKSDARRTAVAAYKEAKKNGVSGTTLANLKATAQAARNTELSATGQNEQAGGIID